MSNILPGYRLTITSWENDADQYKDISFDGLTKEDTAFLIDLASLFTSVNNPKEGKGFGGSESHYVRKHMGRNYWEDLANAWDEVIANHPDISKDARDKFFVQRDEDSELDQDAYSELATKLVSYPGEYYGDASYIRVFSSFEVHYIPQEVEDVTKQFTIKNKTVKGK